MFFKFVALGEDPTMTDMTTNELCAIAAYAAQFEATHALIPLRELFPATSWGPSGRFALPRIAIAEIRFEEIR
jgi:hypothetical protein